MCANTEIVVMAVVLAIVLLAMMALISAVDGIDVAIRVGGFTVGAFAFVVGLVSLVHYVVTALCGVSP